ncbi:MAG: hypothetical protein COB61_002790 [Thiotrichales bacterium]|nr:hypothetical protein [Thiotrichales bacterium]NOX27823.1 hypothetical protein [Gammaproteobacteria bacterium]
MKSAPKEKQNNELAMDSESSLLDEMDEISAEHIQVDAWGNEWDDSGDFLDMDFRLVED